VTSRFPTIAIFITAATWAGFATWLGSNPTALLTAFGIESKTPQMLTEIRAFYGGVEFAVALAMVVLWYRGQLFASLLIGGLPLLGSATGRCVGMLVEGFSGLHAGLAMLELTGAAVCLVAVKLLERNER
jgi:Domain of unknown function (DUF4345)